MSIRLRLQRWLALAVCFGAVFQIYGQTPFVNLDFESARIPSGTAPLSLVPVHAALLFWNASASINNAPIGVSDILYDGFGSSNSLISINDTNTGNGYVPIQGQYTVALRTTVGWSLSIGQTGFVPLSTESLQMDVRSSGNPFSVLMFSGLTYYPINMVPLDILPDYTVYGGDVSALAGKNASLSITEPSPVGTGVNVLELDNISFSVEPVPEPGTSELLLCGAVMFSLKCCCRRIS